MKKLLLLPLLLTACSAMKGPSQDPAKMSADTLCYRGAYAKKNEAIQDEIAARNLDCHEILSRQGAIGSAPVGGVTVGPSY
ncbi:MAG: hypothetical protein LRY39_01740 [Alphaproteobacteria bacterium]|nr:hypothetical protein [Alphaproteobacteria bacterium]